LPEDHPIVWGAILGATAWLVLRWVVAPALDPVLIRIFGWRPLLATCLAFGVVVGLWVHLSRSVAAGLARTIDHP